MGYLPLEFCKGEKATWDSFIDNTRRKNTDHTAYNAIRALWDSIVKASTSSGVEFLEEDDLDEYWSSANAGEKAYTGRFQEFNDAIIGKEGNYAMENILQIPVSDWKNKSRRQELSDIFYEPCIIERWMKNKQVYKLDETFQSALLATEDLDMYRSSLERLPFRTFYIDLSENKDFLPLHGILVDVKKIEKYKQLDTSNIQDAFLRNAFEQRIKGGDAKLIDAAREKTLFSVDIYMITNDKISFSWNSGFIYSGEAQTADINVDLKKSIGLGDELEYNPTIINHTPKMFDRIKAVFLALQFINYISSNEPDVYESPVTKATYRPQSGGIIKNKFSEVQQWDVGIRYGRKIKAKMEEGRTTERRADATPSGSKPRRTMKPHFRAAHWHHYWIGSRKNNEQELIVKWLEPTFVGAGDSANSDVIIHTVG